MMFRADLHCHSTCSDGSLTPSEVLQLAKERGLSGLAITDHDTVDAYPAILSEAEQLGIEMISGVEFSTTVKGRSVHLLGYAFDFTHPAIRDLCQRHKRRREERIEKILGVLRQNDMPVDPEDLIGAELASSIGRPHVAHAMIKRGYVKSVNQAFKQFLSEGKPCFVPTTQFSAEETLDVIHQARGKAVIAHPHLIKHRSTVDYLQNLPFDGIECYYALFPPREEKRWLKLADKKGWMVTGGSDFHGSAKPHIRLGCSWTPEETFRSLRSHFLGHISQ